MKTFLSSSFKGLLLAEKCRHWTWFLSVFSVFLEDLFPFQSFVVFFVYCDSKYTDSMFVDLIPPQKIIKAENLLATLNVSGSRLGLSEYSSFLFSQKFKVPAMHLQCLWVLME